MTAESLADARMMGITHAAFRRDLAPGPASQVSGFRSG